METTLPPKQTDHHIDTLELRNHVYFNMSRLSHQMRHQVPRLLKNAPFCPIPAAPRLRQTGADLPAEASVQAEHTQNLILEIFHIFTPRALPAGRLRLNFSSSLNLNPATGGNIFSKVSSW